MSRSDELPTEDRGAAVELLAAAIVPAAERVAERISRARALDLASSDGEALEGWARALAAGDSEALERRLGWDGISPELAAAALDEAAGWRRLEPAPEWLRLAAATIGAGEDLRTAAAAALPNLPFAELWSPWTGAARRALAGDEALAAMPAAATDGLITHLGLEIARISALAAWELYRSESGDEAAAPGRYSRFVDRRLREGLLALYAAYPVLLRQTSRLFATWRETLAELLDRLQRDRPAIARCFAGGADPGPLVVVERLASDRHAGGRGVFRLGFESGLELVYKPRSMGCEAGLAAVLARLREEGLESAPPGLPVLDRGSHGWMAWAAEGSFTERPEVERWYRRAGALIAVAELLGSEDLHAENLVAAAEGPVIVDAEMLLQPERRGGDARRGESFAAGLLRRGSGGTERVEDWAGLHPAGGRTLAALARGWVELGRDGIAAVPRPVVTPDLPNVPELEGVRTAPEDFSEALLEGYRETWEHLLAGRERWGDERGPLSSFAGARSRILFRPSQEYATVLDLLGSPRYQRSGVAAGMLLEAMLRPLAGQRERPRVWPLVAVERAALEDLDVPRFEAAVEASWIGCGEVQVDGALTTPGLVAALRRARQLHREEVELRVAEVAEALHTAAEAHEEEGLVARGEPSLQSVLELALAKADRLVRFEIDPERRERRGAPAENRLLDLALYEGRLGRALVLAAADRRDGGARLATVRDDLVEDLEEFERLDAPELALGALTGVGSLVWGLVALARASGDDGLLEPARRFGARITAEQLAADQRLDVEGGAAGALLALLALAEATSEERWLGAARAAGERLLATRARQPEGGAAWPGFSGRALAGFAHGAAGIARALSALAEVADAPRFLEGVRDALAFERAVYDPSRRNWPVRLRSARLGEERETWMSAWCHGAPGVLVGRVALSTKARDREVAAEIEAAAATTLASGVGSFDHLCCGAAGRFAALAFAGRREGRPDWLEAARDGSAEILSRAARVPRSRRDPRGGARSLFRGAAGRTLLALALTPPDDPAVLDPAVLERPTEAESGRTR